MTSSEPAGDRSYRALSVGPAAAQALAAGGGALRVHSLFASTLNLAVEGTDWIIALTGPPGGGLPHAIVLEAPGDFRTWPAIQGGPARLLHGELRLEGSAGAVCVDLGEARRPPARPLPRIDHLGGAHRACVLELARLQVRSACDLSIPALGAAERAATPLAAALRGAALGLGEAARDWARSGSGVPAGRRERWRPSEPDCEPLRKAVGALVGLGAGLTPAGDDFLCGFMAAASAGRPGVADAGDGLFALLADAAEANLGRTGELSAGLIRCAMRGLWPWPLVDLAVALVGDLEREALRALESLCQLGHSSGADLATGFLFGLETVIAPDARRGCRAGCPRRAATRSRAGCRGPRRRSSHHCACWRARPRSSRWPLG